MQFWITFDDEQSLKNIIISDILTVEKRKCDGLDNADEQGSRE